MVFTSLAAAFLIAELALATIMAAAWVFQRATHETGWIDAIWTFGAGATGAALVAAPLGDDGSGWRGLAVAAAVALWAHSVLAFADIHAPPTTLWEAIQKHLAAQSVSN